MKAKEIKNEIRTIRYIGPAGENILVRPLGSVSLDVPRAMVEVLESNTYRVVVGNTEELMVNECTPYGWRIFWEG